MEHSYFSKPKAEQTKIQLKIGAIAFVFIIAVITLSIFSGFYLLWILVIITISIIAPFFDVPSLKNSGRLIYYSSLFIAEKENNGTIVVHGGSLFDYYFVIDRSLNGKQRTNFILQKYLEGLLNLMEIHQKNQNTAVKIKGTTYILNERTAHKLGLKTVNTDFIQTLILTFNYVNVLLSHSIAKRKIAFPKLTDIKTFEGEINDLIDHKTFIEGLNEKLKMTL